MRAPKIPPEFEEIFKSLSAEKLINLSSLRYSDGEYLHWDKLVHLDPPENLTNEEWWGILKFHRKGLARSISLRDSKKKPFTFHQTEQMSHAVHLIDQGAGGAMGVDLPDVITNKDTRDYYYISSLMNEAITSSQLEGAAVTRAVAKEMIRTERKPRDNGERMILNNYLTMQQLDAWKDKPLSPEIVFEIHRVITEGTLDDDSAAGRFRLDSEKVEVVDVSTEETIHTPPPAKELEHRLGLMCDFANGNSDNHGFIHPVIRAIILHFWMAYDHPFVDGNGRTARALFYWSMLRSGYWLFQFISISEILVKAPVKYGRSFLLTETDENDLNYFIHYQLKVIERSVKSLHVYIDKKTNEWQQIGPVVGEIAALNYRQEAILIRALKDPGTRFTIRSHQNSHKVAYATARADLFGLVDLNLFRKVKRGKSFAFSPVPNFRGRLDELGQNPEE